MTRPQWTQLYEEPATPLLAPGIEEQAHYCCLQALDPASADPTLRGTGHIKEWHLGLFTPTTLPACAAWCTGLPACAAWCTDLPACLRSLVYWPAYLPPLDQI